MLGETVSVVAPTSYGKSELILSGLRKVNKGNICIIVPTKALISQTKRRIMEGRIPNVKKIITHPEMYLNADKNFIAILTQERLLRLLRKDTDLVFEMVYIDEAHNLLENDERNVLLASAISILEKRNSKVIFKFLTPFLIDSTNLSLKYSKYNPKTFKITEYIKTERFYVNDFRNENKLKFYDQFLNEFYYLENDPFKDDIDLILHRKGDKNIVYFNKPVDLEKFSKKLSERITASGKNTSKIIDKACEEISKYLDKDYFLIQCLKKGFIYHHGSVPDNVRIYIEHLYLTTNDLEFVVTTSTLLEGINIPAQKLFILDNKKGLGNLSPSQFKNLIGRVCRFSEVFSEKHGSLHKLEPEIFLLCSEYIAKKANIEKFIKDCMKVDKEVKDDPKNVLLANVEITDENIKSKKDADEFIENFEKGIVTDYKQLYAETEVGKSCFVNNITEVDIIKNEHLMQSKVEKNRNKLLVSSKEIFEVISEIFIPYLKEKENNNLKRLSYIQTRNFYEMFLNWKIKSATYKEMINSFLKHWKQIELSGKDTLVYVGRWGDEKRGGFRPLWTDIKEKTYSERVNLAIVRIKDEQDFLDNTLIKYIEVLNDLGFLEKRFYEEIKYGTSNVIKIALIKHGFSLGVSNLIVNDYRDFLTVDQTDNLLVVDDEIITEMRENNENEILIYELIYNTKIISLDE